MINLNQASFPFLDLLRLYIVRLEDLLLAVSAVEHNFDWFTQARAAPLPVFDFDVLHGALPLIPAAFNDQPPESPYELPLTDLVGPSTLSYFLARLEPGGFIIPQGSAAELLKWQKDHAHTVSQKAEQLFSLIDSALANEPFKILQLIRDYELTPGQLLKEHLSYLETTVKAETLLTTLVDHCSTAEEFLGSSHDRVSSTVFHESYSYLTAVRAQKLWQNFNDAWNLTSLVELTATHIEIRGATCHPLFVSHTGRLNQFDILPYLPLDLSLPPQMRINDLTLVTHLALMDISDQIPAIASDEARNLRSDLNQLRAASRNVAQELSDVELRGADPEHLTIEDVRPETREIFEVWREDVARQWTPVLMPTTMLPELDCVQYINQALKESDKRDLESRDSVALRRSLPKWVTALQEYRNLDYELWRRIRVGKEDATVPEHTRRHEGYLYYCILEDGTPLSEITIRFAEEHSVPPHRRPSRTVAIPKDGIIGAVLAMDRFLEPNDKEFRRLVWTHSFPRKQLWNALRTLMKVVAPKESRWRIRLFGDFGNVDCERDRVDCAFEAMDVEIADFADMAFVELLAGECAVFADIVSTDTLELQVGVVIDEETWGDCKSGLYGTVVDTSRFPFDLAELRLLVPGLEILGGRE